MFQVTVQVLINKMAWRYIAGDVQKLYCFFCWNNTNINTRAWRNNKTLLTTFTLCDRRVDIVDSSNKLLKTKQGKFCQQRY